MSRVALSCVLIVAACSAAGCRKSANSSSPSAPSSPSANPVATAPAGSTRAGGDQGKTLSADDQLMLDYLKTRHECAELLAKKAPEAQIREASARSSAKLRELQALPTARQAVVQKKYQEEWDAAKARMEKAITSGQP